RLIPDNLKPSFFQEKFRDAVLSRETKEIFRGVMNGHYHAGGSPADYVNRSLYFEIKTFLHGLLVVEDKLSMAHSLESRVPLLDHVLVDFATQLPTRYLINPDWDKNPDRDENLAGKYLFRRAMEGVLPDYILLKRKQGFSAPEQFWYQGPLMTYVKTVLLDRKALSRGFF